jgi:transcription-repair coupling factor (superfamily II helicase)
LYGSLRDKKVVGDLCACVFVRHFTGKTGHLKIYKLGSNAWKVLKQKTKARVKNIAFNLIQLYAKGD